MRVLLLGLSLFATVAPAATVLFPKPLHLTRDVADPITGRTSRVEQYCLANRVVSVTGPRTIIADYDRSELTEIDRAHGTYSVTPFATIAGARPRRKVVRATANSTAPAAGPSIERKGSDRRAGRNVDVFAGDDAAHALHADVAVDESTALSRDAFDVLVGAAFPGEGDDSTELIRGAARRAVNGAESYGLPLEQILRWSVSGTTVTAVNRVTAVADDLAPPELVAIPPGAKRVDSPVVVTARESEQLDALPGKARP